MSQSLPEDQAAEILANRPRSIGAMIDRRVDATPHLPAFQYPDANEQWQTIDWTEFREWVHTVAASFLALGLQPEERVAIAASSRIEWIVADLANNCAGGATTSIYPNTYDDECHYILEHSGSVMAIVENEEILQRIVSAPAAGQLRCIVVLDGTSTGDDERVITWQQFRDRGREYLQAHPDSVREAIAATGPDTLATLIYTSGTTGRPKGVELTHDNWIYEAAAMQTLDILGTDDVHFLWLPMSHVFGKCLIAIDITYGTVTAVDGRIDKIVANLAVVRPTLMCGAPRIFEKVRAAVMTRYPRSGIKGRMSRWAFSVGRQAYPFRISDKPMPKLLAAKYAVADKLVYSKLRELVGGRLRFFISGSAKLSAQVQAWFFSAGLVLVEGYGMTESTAISFLNDPRTPRFGTVGTVSFGSEVRIADDGEILVKGPGVTRGYHHDPELTAEAITDGWLHTGDIGHLDSAGNLHVTDRKKDLIKTSGGKYVSPQKVESVLAANIPYVSQVVAAGEGRKYVSALLVLEADSLFKWAKRHQMEDRSYAELSQLPQIRESIQRYVDRANTHLEHWETVKRFAILDRELTLEDNEVTPNQKVRRAKVLERNADVVDGLYDADVPGDSDK